MKKIKKHEFLVIQQSEVFKSHISTNGLIVSEEWSSCTMSLENYSCKNSCITIIGLQSKIEIAAKANLR